MLVVGVTSSVAYILDNSFIRMDAQELAARYKTLFKPEIYLEKSYGKDLSTIHTEIKNIVDFLNEVFSGGKL